jgi:hypothetical protein
VFPTALPAPALPAHTPVLARAQAILARLADHALSVVKGMSARIQELATAPTPSDSKDAANADAEQTKLLKAILCPARAIRWAALLVNVLSGRIHIPAPTYRAAQPKAPKPQAGAPAQPEPSKPAKPAKPRKPSLAALYRVFATRSIGYIVTRICYDLGLDYDDDDFWPDELIAITQTPAQYSAMLAANPVPPRPTRQASPSAPTPNPDSTQHTTTLTEEDPADPPAKPPPDPNDP